MRDKRMLPGHNLLLDLSGKLALLALVLAACAAPAVVPPTAAPTEPATATVIPTTAVMPDSTQALLSNVAVPATSVLLNGVGDFAFDIDGNYYVTDCGVKAEIYKINPLGLLTVYAGTGGFGFSGDGGPARSADLFCPSGLAFDHDGNLYVADSGNNRIRRIDRNGIISTVAGSGPSGFGGDSGLATAALLQFPTEVAFDRSGDLYIADSGNNRIRKVDPAGIITSLAGKGTIGFSGDGGAATAAELNLSVVYRGTSVNVGISGMALDAQDNLYFADTFNARVRKVDQQGIITTFAGTGEPIVSGDGGPAAAAALSFPTGLAFDAAGNLYITSNPNSQTFDARVRKIDRRGIITTVVGTGALDYSGDGGPALSATLKFINGIAFDPRGNLYIADIGNQRVRRVDTNGIITTVAGGGF